MEKLPIISPHDRTSNWDICPTNAQNFLFHQRRNQGSVFAPTGTPHHYIRSFSFEVFLQCSKEVELTRCEKIQNVLWLDKTFPQQNCSRNCVVTWAVRGHALLWRRIISCVSKPGCFIHIASFKCLSAVCSCLLSMLPLCQGREWPVHIGVLLATSSSMPEFQLQCHQQWNVGSSLHLDIEGSFSEVKTHYSETSSDNFWWDCE